MRWHRALVRLACALAPGCLWNRAFFYTVANIHQRAYTVSNAGSFHGLRWFAFVRYGVVDRHFYFYIHKLMGIEASLFPLPWHVVLHRPLDSADAPRHTRHRSLG